MSKPHQKHEVAAHAQHDHATYEKHDAPSHEKHAAPVHPKQAHAAHVHLSLFSKFKAWLRLVRIEHALMSALGVLIGLLLAAGSLPLLLSKPLPILLLALGVPILINIGAFALNDYWDVEADRLNGRLERPLVSGALSPQTAITTASFGLLSGILFGGMLNPACSAVAALFAFLSLAYDRYFKDWPLVGNLTIALSMAIAFVFGGLALGLPISQMPAPLTLLTIGAFLAGLGRELIKTVQDMEGDKMARHSRSLPLLIGERPCLVLAGACYVAFAATAMLLLMSGPAFGVLSGGLLLLCALAFLTMSSDLFLTPPTQTLLEQWRKASLWALLIGLVGITLAAI